MSRKTVQLTGLWNEWRRLHYLRASGLLRDLGGALSEGVPQLFPYDGFQTRRLAGPSVQSAAQTSPRGVWRSPWFAFSPRKCGSGASYTLLRWGSGSNFLYGFAFFIGNSILGTGWGHSFAADDAEPSHHFAQESPQPCNLINLMANAYYGKGSPISRMGKRTRMRRMRASFSGKS
ncbi:MAG TPA: hypothetical protein VK463_20435 [Desulfomonilaceae bacterium]|nr:hypothetical protein [Desulfomonilaceae bacterium]